MAYDEVIAVVTLVGSAVSSIATAGILGCFIVFHRKMGSFRHALIFNLALSDFINSTSYVISGAIYVRDHALYPGTACRFNGWIGQLSVQATDFSILAIAISTLLIVVRRTLVSEISKLQQICVCLSVWIIPIITSTTAISLGAFVPVGNNWCWISGNRTDLRYALTHGWRLAIIFSTVLIYAYIYWYLQRHFKSMLIDEPSSDSGLQPYVRRPSYVIQSSISTVPINVSHTLTAQKLHHSNPFEQTSPSVFSERSVIANELGEIGTLSDIPAAQNIRKRSRKMEKEVRRMLLLRGYPMLYAAGNEAAANSRVLIGLQASTQFVGLANAITYGWNQQWRQK
ncbi:G protein-coupled glucose receptor regulating Gpa2-domain-containing protein [Xylaria arbuscula]|nr:G protein-coupled glucose receptor regulating Gpa2-domain-containing protein [Xylaria arbuscula]